MADIFLSYAREDEARARQLADALASRGWSVWWDRRIQHGKDFQVVIQAELDSAKCIVVLWSTASIGSKFVRDEATEGQASDGRPDRLVPVLLEAVKPPLGFRGMHNANLIDWRGQVGHEEFDRLLTSIASMAPPAGHRFHPESKSPASTTSSVVARLPPSPGTAPVRGGFDAITSATVPLDTRASNIGARLVVSPRREAVGTKPARDRSVEAAAPDEDIHAGASAWAPELASTRESRLPRILRMAFDYRRSLLSVVVALSLGLLAINLPRGTAEKGSSEEASTGVPPRPEAAPLSGGASTPAPTPAPAGQPRFRASAWNLPNDGLLGFVEIPAGAFTMGSNKSQDSQADDEIPQHSVSLPAYFIGRYEVTVGQYTACVQDGGCKPGDRRAVDGDDTLPVRYVSWQEALAYSRWLEGKLNSRAEFAALPFLATGWHFTLPSEAEWEKAARGSDVRVYPWGGSIDPTKANYLAAIKGGPTPVGSYPAGASPYGLLDMSGNVSEWTRSLYQNYPYRASDGREDLSAGNNAPRVVRGGSFDDDGWVVRAASRGGNVPSVRFISVGFRVVVSPFSPGTTGAKS